MPTGAEHLDADAVPGHLLEPRTGGGLGRGDQLLLQREPEPRGRGDGPLNQQKVKNIYTPLLASQHVFIHHS